MDRAACERRVYRLATLLTGNPELAAAVITAVVDAQPDVSALDNSHMDRLTVLRSREIKPAVLLSAQGVSPAVAKGLAGLPGQQREAWVFARVYRMETRELARSMDCSLTAVQRHLDQADETMAQRLGVPVAAEAPAQLLKYTMALDVPAFYRSAKRARRMMKWLLIGLAAATIIVAAIVLLRAGWPVAVNSPDRAAQ